MLPGSRDSSPDTISNTASGQLPQSSGCCDWLDKICGKFLSKSSNSGHQSDYSDGGQHSNEFTLGKDSTGYDNQWRDDGGRFFACTGSLLVAADCSSKVTIPYPSGRRNEKQVCLEYVGKQRGLCTRTSGSSRIGRMDSTIPAVGNFLSGHHGNLDYGNYTNRSLLQCQSSFLGLSSTGKTCRSSKDLNSSYPRKAQAGSLKSYETMLSCPTEYFLSSAFRTLSLPETTCSRSFLKDFKRWGKTSTWHLSEQTLFISNDNISLAKELINFDRQGLCINILEQANSNPAVAFVCSKLARHGYLLRGRGAVALLFKTSEKASLFTVPDFRVASFSYVYLINDSPVNSERPGKHQSKFEHLCQLYNPDCQYIFSVTVDAYEEVCCNPLSIQGEDLISQMDDDLVARFCAKLPVYILRSLNLSLDISDPGATLILTSVPGLGLSENGDERRAREICFFNIQQKLRQRGVSLRHQFPEIYRRLCAYTEMNVDFVPVSLFLSDLKTSKKFLCLIMPNSEPFSSWMEELFKELGPETVV